MRFTFNVTDENVFTIYDDGFQVFSRGPYASYSEAESVAANFARDLSFGSIRVQDLFGYDFKVYKKNDNSLKTKVEKYVDSIISENPKNTEIQIGDVKYNLHNRIERERAVNYLLFCASPQVK
jgi:hypothetical protein